MHIIKGIYKGRNLVAPKNIPTRPTTSFAKEGLFNILEHRLDISGLRIMDLFSGTGSISFEFASRGADYVLSVEQNRVCASFIIKTALNLEANVRVSKQNVFKFLLKENTEPFDIIFADPPYQSDKLKNIPNLIFSKNWLAPEGWLIVEHGKENNFEKENNFQFSRKFGHVNFSFFCRSAE